MRTARAPNPDSTPRRVTFPDDDGLVTGYLEPDRPWTGAEDITGDELIRAYVQSCDKHKTTPLECVINQLKEITSANSSCRQGTLTLAGCALTPMSCEALEAILRKVRFQRIDLRDCQLTDESAVALFDMIEYYESASELDISSNHHLGIPAWQSCSKMINKSQWLEQVEIRDTSLGENSAPVLGRGLRSPCSLRCLHLQRSRLAGAPLLCLAGYLKQNKSVRELHIGDNHLVASDAKHLASMLKSNFTLQLLDISNNDIQDSGVEAITEALAEQSFAQSSTSSSSSESSLSSPQSNSSGSVQDRGLVVLILWNNNLTRNSGNHFSRALSRCRSLEVLNMGQNPLCGETVNRFRSALQQNRSLLSLGMQSTKLGAEAAIALAEVIEDNPVIQRIDLRDNKLQAAGLLALATALKKNHTVTRIDLDDVPPTQLDKEHPLEETRLVTEIRLLCKRNELHLTPPGLASDEDESTSAHRRRAASFTTRKISLTCQTLHTVIEPSLSPPKTSSGRLRSPSPSPIPSPASSPIPSPSHRSRFQVSRVSNTTPSSSLSPSPSPSTPQGSKSFFSGNSRFRVVSVQEPPSISVQGPEDNVSKDTPMIDVSSQTETVKFVKCPNSRFSIVRNVDIGNTQGNTIIKHKSVEPSNSTTVKDNNSSDSGGKTNNSIGASNNTKTSQTVCLKESDTSGKHSSAENEHLPSINFKKDFNVIKKNKSESSLDSPDLEVSRLMQSSGKKNAYDSSSSLDISGSSMESLNTLEFAIDTRPNNEDKQLVSKQTFSLDSEENDVFVDKVPPKFENLSSNESSLESSAPVEVPQRNVYHFSNQSSLNLSVSSDESVSPNIFGKHMKLHGSVTSLEASFSSLDSFKATSNILMSPSANDASKVLSLSQENYLIDSTDSGIFHSDNSPRTTNDSVSSNEGTLTDNSNLSRMIRSIGSSLEIQGISSFSDKSKTPKRTASLLDVPSSSTKQRTRKISWVNTGPSVSAHSLKKDTDDISQQKAPSSLEKLFNIFQNPGSIFSRNLIDTNEKKSDGQQKSSQHSSSGISTSFWPWSIGNSTPPKTQGKNEETSNDESEASVSRVTSSISAEYTVKLPEKVQLQDENLTSTTATVFGSNTEIPENLTSDNDVNNVIIEHEILPCDNVDEIETKDPDIIYSDICDTVKSNEELLPSRFGNRIFMSIASCDSKMVQSKLDDADMFPENVTTHKCINDDNDIPSDAVQSNLLVLSSSPVISDEPETIPHLFKENNESEADRCFVKSVKIDSVSHCGPDVQDVLLIDLEMEIDEVELCHSDAESEVMGIETDEIQFITGKDDCADSTNNVFEQSNMTTSDTVIQIMNLAADNENISQIPLKICDTHIINNDTFMFKMEDESVSNVDLNKSDVENVGSVSLMPETIAKLENDILNTLTIDDVLNDVRSIDLKDDQAYQKKLDMILRSDHDENIIKISTCLTDNIENVKNEFSLSDECSVIESNKKIEKNAPPLSVLKQSIGLENKTSPGERQPSPESGPSIENLPNKIIKRIKENISPENTITSSMTNTQALVQELADNCKIESVFLQIFDKQTSNNNDQSTLKIESFNNNPDENTEEKFDVFNVNDKKKSIDCRKKDVLSDSIERGIDLIDLPEGQNFNKMDDVTIAEPVDVNLGYEIEQEIILNSDKIANSDVDFSQENNNTDVSKPIQDNVENDFSVDSEVTEISNELENSVIENQTIEMAKDVLDVLNLSEQTASTDNVSCADSDVFETSNATVSRELSALNENIGSGDERILEDDVDDDETKNEKVAFKPISILKKSNNLKHRSLPRNIPEHNRKVGVDDGDPDEKHAPMRCGSLPDSISRYSPQSLPDSLANRNSKSGRSRTAVNSLGKLARDSLYALNMSEEEIAELTRSRCLSSMESVRSLGSVSEDVAEPYPLRKVFSSSESRSLGPCTSQESLASLTSISEITVEGGSVANVSKPDPDKD